MNRPNVSLMANHSHRVRHRPRPRRCCPNPGRLLSSSCRCAQVLVPAAAGQLRCLGGVPSSYIAIAVQVPSSYPLGSFQLLDVPSTLGSPLGYLGPSLPHHLGPTESPVDAMVPDRSPMQTPPPPWSPPIGGRPIPPIPSYPLLSAAGPFLLFSSYLFPM